MELIKARDVAREDLKKLVDNYESIEMERLIHSGYVMKQAGHFEGCFVLENKDQQTLWLRQMYVTKDTVISLPILLEAVLALAKERQVGHVVIHSHHTTLDTILEALQFSKQIETSGVDNLVDNPGKWWIYNVS